MVWKPRVTVAAVIENNGKFLLVEEDVGSAETVFNQPAGHLEKGESLIAAVTRETLEETGYEFEPSAVTGIYRWIAPSGDTYLRATFCGHSPHHRPNQALDEGIIAPHWLNLDEIKTLGPRLRSPLVLRCIEDYLSGQRYPTALLKECVNQG
jgi:8-oxo-dGTP pyrophosphatase MutT (NUDIX family)